MKKILFGASVAAAIALMTGCSSTHQMNPTPSEQKAGGISSAEEAFNREKEIKEAYEKGLKVGISKGYDKAAKIITDEYLPYMKRLEAGKYVMKKGYVTAPEVMVFQKNDGTLNYRVSGCKIEKELDVNDIFKRFGKSVVVGEDVAAGDNAEAGEDVAISGYHLAERDEIIYPVMRPGSVSERMIKNIEKTTANRIVLDEYNIRYSEKDGVYVATFATKEEMEGFCSQFRICVKD